MVYIDPDQGLISNNPTIYVICGYVGLRINLDKNKIIMVGGVDTDIHGN